MFVLKFVLFEKIMCLLIKIIAILIFFLTALDAQQSSMPTRLILFFLSLFDHKLKRSGQFPSQFKDAIIRPLLKKTQP